MKTRRVPLRPTLNHQTNYRPISEKPKRHRDRTGVFGFFHSITLQCSIAPLEIHLNHCIGPNTAKSSEVGNMKRLIVMVVIIALVLSATVALATSYRWNDSKRPPISLSGALARAEKLLGEDAANRYCVSVYLAGDGGDGKLGGWNLFYAATDGSKRLVMIDMQGNSQVKPWNGPISSKVNRDRRKDLAEVRRRLDELFAKEVMKATFTAGSDSLLVEYKTREFQVYSRRDDGSYSEKLETVRGPEADGIWIRIQQTNELEPEKEYVHGPYWNENYDAYILTTEGKFISVDLRYGLNSKEEVIRQVHDVFGQRRPY